MPPLIGDQTPRICVVPDFVSSAGVEVVELCASVGLIFDSWQAFVLNGALGERPDGNWAASRIGLTVSRQNGKGAVLEGRQLGGLFLFGERLQTYSAHLFDTSLEAFRRLLFWIENNDDLRRRVKKVSKAHGEEGIELINGQRIRFRTRTRTGGRGIAGETIYLDEDMVLPTNTHAALFPTTAAQPNSQAWYTGSAPDELEHEHCEVKTRLRAQALGDKPRRIAYFEWSPDVEPDESALVLDDRKAWAAANPGLGIRITDETIEDERSSLDARTFSVERLSIGRWPNLDELDDELITDTMLAATCDEDSFAYDPVCIAFDVKPDRSWSAISAAGFRDDGRRHIETIEHRPGTQWVISRLIELRDTHRPIAIKCDERGPAASLLKRAENEGLEIETVNTAELTQACGDFFDGFAQAQIRHLGTSELVTAAKGAAKRSVGDSWLWSRKNSKVDISPLVAATIADHGLLAGRRPSIYDEKEGGIFV